MTTVADLITRARSQIGQGTRYRLGSGTTLGADPRDESGACDCSAFVCWCLDLRKRQTAFAWLTRLNGGWYNTDGIWWDALKEPTGNFARIEAPRPGAIVVYPSRTTSGQPGPTIGHIGIVTRVSANGFQAVHCSNGNYRNTNDAIRETAGTVFSPAAAIFAWAASVV